APARPGPGRWPRPGPGDRASHRRAHGRPHLGAGYAGRGKRVPRRTACGRGGGRAMSNRPILLVEDNPDDVELTRIAFAQAKIANPLHVVDNGVEALDYLFGRGDRAQQPKHEAPALILLDLNMPRMDGREV